MILSFDLGTTKLLAMLCFPDPAGGGAGNGMDGLHPGGRSDPADGGGSRWTVLDAESADNDATLPGLPGHHEQEMRQIASKAISLAQLLLERHPKAARALRRIAISGQMHGLLPVVRAEEGCGLLPRPLGPLVTWRDTRTAASASAWRDRLDPGAPLRAGCRLSPGYGGLTLASMIANGQWPKNAVAQSAADYLAGRLTGVIAAEATHAASWGLLDIAASRWDEPICAALGVRGALPNLRPSAAPLAPLSPRAALLLGLPPGLGVMVHSPVGDNQASFLGATEACSAEAVLVNLGTGGQVSWRLAPDDPVMADGDIETRPLPGGGRLAVAASLCGGWSWQYLAGLFRDIVRECAGRELPLDNLYGALNRLAASGEAGAGGLAWSPLFLGARSDGSAKGALTGMDAANLTPGHLARAMADGIANELAGHFWRARRGGRDWPGPLVASGNGTRRNPALRDALARAFGRPCETVPEKEEAAIGAAMAVERA